MMRGGGHVVPVLLLLLLLALASTATAHGDRPREAGTTLLEPGSAITLTHQVHWHRLMGTVQANAPVTVTIEGPDGVTEVAGPASSLTLDHLITCCDEAVWTPHTIRIVNAGSDPVSVTYEVVLLHDNLAVTAHDAEPGAWWQTLIIVLSIIAIPALRARQPPVDGAAEAWIRASRILHVVAWGIALVAAAYGMARFGTGPLTGSLGATASAPSGGDGFLNTHSYLMLGLMALWGAAVACWAGARRRLGSPRAYRTDGLLFAAGPLVVGTLMAVEFGPVLIPLLMAVVPAAVLAVDALWERDPGASDPREPAAPGA